MSLEPQCGVHTCARCMRKITCEVLWCYGSTFTLLTSSDIGSSSESYNLCLLHVIQRSRLHLASVRVFFGSANHAHVNRFSPVPHHPPVRAILFKFPALAAVTFSICALWCSTSCLSFWRRFTVKSTGGACSFHFLSVASRIHFATSSAANRHANFFAVQLFHRFFECCCCFCVYSSFSHRHIFYPFLFLSFFSCCTVLTCHSSSA